MNQPSGGSLNDDSPASVSCPPAVPPEDGANRPDLTLPSQPDFQVLNQIGRGAYGEVYLTRDSTGKYWAVKVVYRVSFENDRPYEREYNGIRQFEPISQSSDSQLQIRHVGRRDEAGYFYYIMEAADDIVSARDINPDTYSPRTLKSELARNRRLPPRECAQIALGLADALGNLHQHGLIHRDVKPANIIFVGGRPKLADLGLVTATAQTMTCVGTEGYIPPEGPNSVRADIYALGKVLYQMLTGCDLDDFPKLPVDLEERPDHALLLQINRIIAKACQAQPRKRYQSVQKMREDLEQALAGNLDPSRLLGRRPVMVCLTLVLLGVGLFGFKWLRREEANGGSPKGTVSVSAKASIFWVGSASVARRAQRSVRITLPPGTRRILMITEVTGTISSGNGRPRFGADGDGPQSAIVNIQNLNGISSVLDTSGGGGLALMGVFTSATEPGQPPPRVNFVTLKHQPIIAPQLCQVFFVGDGLTKRGSGERQQFIVPDEATLLHLGFADASNYQGRPGYYGDNTGELTVTYSITQQLK